MAGYRSSSGRSRIIASRAANADATAGEREAGGASTRRPTRQHLLRRPGRTKQGNPRHYTVSVATRQQGTTTLTDNAATVLTNPTDHTREVRKVGL